MTILVRIQNMKKIANKKPQIFPLKQKKITNHMNILVITQNLKMRLKKIFSFKQNNNISDENSNTNSKDDKE
jgi:hypothetical protein